MPTTPIPEHKNLSDRLSGVFAAPAVYGLAAIALIAVASFAFAYEYMSNAHVPATAVTAAVATEQLPDPFAGIQLQAKSVYVMDAKTSEVLFAKNPDTQLPLASITKVALVLAVSEALSPNTVITIPYDTAAAGAKQRLAKGEKWKVQDVINFTLISSSNEGADILAAAADSAIHKKYPDSPETGATIWRMNRIAKELGLANTYFLNASGLDLSTTQSGAYSSAHDVASMFIYAASTTPNAFAGTAENGLLLTDEAGNTTSAINTNEALGDIPGLIMGKTGFTDLAGGNLAVMFDAGLAHPLIAIVLGSTHEGRFTDMKAIVDAARKAVMQR